MLNELVDQYAETSKKVDEKFIDACFEILSDKTGVDELENDICQQMTLEDPFLISGQDQQFCRNYQQIYQDHHGDILEDKYGTRSSTLVFVYKLKDKVKIIERSMKLDSNVQIEDCPILKREIKSGPFAGGTEVRFG